ncbi:MAG: hypothetical protein RL687_533 [Candidatus Parcubacteria bacterium]|jgi:predicted RNA-binding protein with PUA-like domain
MRYWLIKSEGDCYSIVDLKKDKKVAWTGIRNYQARNFMMNDMSLGDMALFYHSNGTTEAPTGVYGIARVASAVHPDETQFDKKDEHYDPKSSKSAPIWHCVDMAFMRKFKNPVTLAEIKIDPALEGMLVRDRGSRLSIQPVSAKNFEYIVNLSN